MRLRITCFPSDTLRPKHDFVMHYPDLFYHFGRLKHIWTLRFESKHSYFKIIAESSKNFKTIHLTSAQKHELLQVPLEEKYQITVKSRDAVPYLQGQYEAKIDSLNNDFMEKNFLKITHGAKNVEFCNIRYSESMCICVGKNTFGNFIICKIKYILINEAFNYIYFLGWTDEIVPYVEIGVCSI